MADFQHSGSAFARMSQKSVTTANDGHTLSALVCLTPQAVGALAPVAPHLELGERVASGEVQRLAGLRFSDAVKAYMAAIEPTVRGRTSSTNRTHANALNKFFGSLRVRDIHIGHLNAYQAARSTNAEGRWTRVAAASAVNHELSLLQRVLKRANCWGTLGDLYKALPSVDSGRRKVMTDIEERRFRAVAASRPEWELAYHVTMLTLTTTRAGTELRNLQLQDVLLDGAEPRIVINGATAKNGFRGGSVGLYTEAGLASARWCMARARKLGATRPEHYIFPFGVRGRGWDVTRPASGSWLRRAWEELRIAAGVPWLTPHCLRHQAITKLAEAKVPDEGIRQIAGHVSAAMLRVYSHCRLEHQAANLKLLEVSETAKKPSSRPSSSAGSGSIDPRLRRFMAGRRRRAA